MPQLDAESLRAIQMKGEDVCCVDVSAQHLLWCSRWGTVSALHVWWCDKEHPRAAPLVELGFTPTIVSSFQEKILVIGEVAQTLFVLERTRPVRIKELSAELEEEEELVLTEEFLFSGIVSGASHVAWTPDGAAVAISSLEKLVLVDCRAGCSGVDMPCPYVLVDCSSWYGHPGAAFAACSASRLFVLSAQNHLVSARYDESLSTVPMMERDGHIIARAHRVTCFAVGSSEEGHLVVGLSGGTVRLLQQDTLEVFFTMDVTRRLYRMRDAARQHQMCPEMKEGELCVLNVAVGRRLMVVVRPDAILCYDKNSLDLLEDRTTFLPGEVPTLSMCSGDGSWCIWLPKTHELLYHAAAAAESTGKFLSTALAEAEQHGEEDDMVHARTPLPMRLLEPIRLPSQKEKPRTKQVSTGRARVKFDKTMIKKNVDQPVTFGHPIRSSRYAAEVPWSIQQREKKLHAKARNVSLPLLAVAPATRRYKAATTPWSPLRPMTAANNIIASSPIHSGAVMVATFSAGGAALLTASSDTAANWLKYPVARNGGAGTMMRAHTGPVNTADVSLSINSPIVATGSTDGVVAIWQPCKREAFYIKQTVGREIRGVRFFYTDKFICYASGNTVTLCRYALDDGGDDLNRKRNESMMEPALEFTVESTQHVVALDAINYFTSNVMMWAGSNKSVGVYDVAAERTVQVVEEAHTRPIHHLSMMTAGRYATPSTSLLHMYLTAGLDSTVRIWDLRQRRSVRQLALHRNTATPVGVAFSPNGAMVAVGSETSAVCVYDIKSGMTIDKVAVGDVPTALGWHPLENVLAVGTAAGAIKLMGQV